MFVSSIWSLPQASLQVVPEQECQLWWAAKELHREKKLQDYIGKNEKTKIVVKIQKVGTGHSICVQLNYVMCETQP